MLSVNERLRRREKQKNEKRKKKTNEKQFFFSFISRKDAPRGRRHETHHTARHLKRKGKRQTDERKIKDKKIEIYVRNHYNTMATVSCEQHECVKFAILYFVVTVSCSRACVCSAGVHVRSYGVCEKYTCVNQRKTKENEREMCSNE